MNAPSRLLDFTFRDELLRDPEHAAFYLDQILESGKLELFQEALRTVAKAQEGGVSCVAKKANVSRENLYDALSKTGKPKKNGIDQNT